MALQSAADTQTASDSAKIQPRGILSSLTMTDISDTIAAQANRTDTESRIYKVVMTLACVSDNLGRVQIIQSDSSKVLLSDIVDALTDPAVGYRVAYKTIRESRDGLNDRVKLQIAWG